MPFANTRIVLSKENTVPEESERAVWGLVYSIHSRLIRVLDILDDSVFKEHNTECAVSELKEVREKCIRIQDHIIEVNGKRVGSEMQREIEEQRDLIILVRRWYAAF